MLDGSVTVDHRLLTESGRAEILQQQKDLPENFRQSAENIVQQLPEGEYRDKVLKTLNNIQAKLVQMPNEMKVGGEILEKTYPEFIRLGGEPKDFEQMFNDPETLLLIKEANEYVLLKDQAVSQLIQNGYSSEVAKNIVSNLEQEATGNINSDLEPDYVLLKKITSIATDGVILPNAQESSATFGSEDIIVNNTTNTLLEVVTKAGQIKQRVDKKIEDSGINPQYVGLVFGLVLGGPANLAKSMVVDYLAGDEFTTINKQMITDLTAMLHDTDSELVNNVLNNKQVIQESGNKTAQQLVNQLQLTEDGIEVVSSIVLGGTGAVIGKGIAKGKEDGSIGSTKNINEETSALNRIKDNDKGADLSNKPSDSIINQQASKRVDEVTAPIDFDGHILNAEIKRNGNVVGGHSIASGNVKVLERIGQPDKNGVYEAKIAIADPSNPGKYLAKSNNQGRSTMFPDSWTASRLKVEVDAAYKNRVLHPDPQKAAKGMWYGKTPSGVIVEGYTQPNTTVYPLYGK